MSDIWLILILTTWRWLEENSQELEYLQFACVNGIKADIIYVLKRKTTIQFHVLVVAVAIVGILGF